MRASIGRNRTSTAARRNQIIAVLTTLAFVAACSGGKSRNPFKDDDPNSFPPGKVTQVTATGTDGGIVVDWFGFVIATGYNVYWSDSPGVTKQNGNLVSFDLPPGTITGLTNGNTYYAIVTAVNDFGESEASEEVQAVAMLQPPEAVIGVKAEPGDAEASVEWFDLDSADSYSVFWGTNPGGGGTEIADATSPTTVTGLTNSQTYYFSVSGTNAAGEGPPSFVVEATPVAPVPGWTPQTEINTPFSGLGTRATLEDVTVNNNGVAAALWRSNQGQFGSLERFVANHTATGDWGEQEILANTDDSGAIAVSAAGDVHFVYDDGATIRSRRFSNGAWADPETISNSSGVDNSFGVGLAADDAGNVFASWVEDTIPPNSSNIQSTQAMWVARFDGTTETWGDPVLLNTSLSWIQSPKIAIGSDDTAVVAWLEDSVLHDNNIPSPPDQRVVVASRYDGTDWAAAAVVGRNDLMDQDNGEELVLETSADGSAVVAWSQTRSTTGDPEALQFEAVRFDAALDQWSAPELLVDGLAPIVRPDITLNGAGQSVATWLFGANTVPSATLFDPVTSTWSGVTTIPTDVLGGGDPFGIESAENGGAVVAWAKEFQAPKGVFVRRQDAGATFWNPSDHLGGRAGDGLLIAMSRNGHAVVVIETRVIQREDFNNVVYAQTYTP